MAENDDIKFVKENSIASKPITKKDLDKPQLIIGFMKNEKGSDYNPAQRQGNILTIKKRGDVYDFYRGDELRPSNVGIDADEVLRVLNNRNAGYTYLATSRKDPKLARWINIDDEDIYTNRLRSDADPTRPLEFIGEERKSVATIDPQTATLREVAEAYAKKSGRKDFVGPTIQYFKDIADEPGSALLLFQKDKEGRTLLARTLTSLPEDSPVKTAMQNIRQVGLLLKENIGPDTPEYKLLPDEKPDTDLNKRIFGRAEPTKAESQVAISSDPKKQAKLFEGVSKYLDDPTTRPAALAIIFNLNTGLRPNAVLGLTLDQYFPDSGAVYVESDAKGAKGRAVNIPLNPVADAILQELLVGKQPGDRFFTKSTGARVRTADVNKILRAVKVPKIMYDQATKTFYDSLHPEDGPSKSGSPLLRNVHSSVSLSIGIPQERTAYLQGRSLKAASKGSTGELATYQKPFPGEVSDVDREFSSQVSSFYGKSAKAAGFDIQSKIPMPESRITTQTAGYENYFDLPVKDEASQVKALDSEKADLIPESNPEARARLKQKGFDAEGMADAISKYLGKGAKVLAAGIGIETARQIVTEPAAVARDMAIEGALLAAKAPVAVATAASMAMEPKQTAIQTLTEEERKNPQFTQNIPEPLADEEQEAMRDTGFVNIDRGPEAASINQDQGFLSR